MKMIKESPQDLELALAKHISTCGSCWPEGLASTTIGKGLCGIGLSIFERLKYSRKNKDIDYDTGLGSGINERKA